MSRLTWLLAGLDGQEPWGEDAADVISLQAAARIQPERLVARIRELSASHAPLDLVGLDIRGQTARARIRDHAGSVTVVACTVEADSPHRVTSVIVSGLVPDYLVPRLPMDFTGYPLARAAGDGTRLVVFSGVPGTGKSTLSDAVGRRLGIPVFAVDWLLGSLTPFGGYHMDAAWDMGPEMLTTLAVRQLALGQSAILDFPTEDQANRTRWRTLAHQAGADFKVILCVCSDQQVHRARLEDRERGIPGWHQGGNWANVERRMAEFPAWQGEVLTVDTAQPHESNIADVLRYLGARP